MSLDLGLTALRRLDAHTPLGELVAALNEHRPDLLLAYPSMASVSQRVDTMLRLKLLAAGVTNPQLDVKIVAELPREQGYRPPSWLEEPPARSVSPAHENARPKPSQVLDVRPGGRDFAR